MDNNNIYNSLEDIPLPVFSDNTLEMKRTHQNTGFSNENDTITAQPTRFQNREEYPGTRRPIPVSIIDENASQSYITPLSGLEFMRDATQLIVQQSVELTDLMANVSSENRYTVKVPRGETVYYATESSESFQRTCFGSGRAFSMRLYDRTQQEALHFKRRLACGNCTFWCYLQKLEVWIPPGELVGTIIQNISCLKTSFNVYNRHDEPLFIIEGPNSFCCLMEKKQNFQIYTADGSTQIGSIIYQWDQLQVSYNLLLQMPGSINDNRHKALLLGSAFLLEYMFFESSKKKNSCKCIC